MPNIYLLIQNDLETGPYTLEELLQLPLQSKDLVWIIGQSEDWLHPLHIPALKHYFLEGEKEPVLRPEVKTAIINNRFIGHVSGVPSITFGSVRSTPKFLDAQLLKNNEQKPFLLEQPITIALPAAAQKQIGTPSAGEERKSIMPQSVLQQETEKPKSTPPVDVLDEDETEEKFTKHQKPILIALSVVLLLFLINFYRQSAASREQNIPVVESQKQVVKTPYISNTPKAIPVAQAEPAATENIEEPVASAVAATEEENKANPVDSYIDSINDEVARQDKLHEESSNFLDRQVIRNIQRKKYAVKAFTKPASTKPFVQSAKPLHQQIALKSRYLQQGNKQKLTGVEVTVQNNSPKFLKTVSVEVMYYRNGERLLDKETMYFTNLHPRQSLTLSKDGHKKATSARFQLGAIQAAEIK